jgi:hypothetical protein
VPEALHEVRERRLLARERTPHPLHVHEQQARDHRKIADRVQQEAPPFADGRDQRPRDGRTYDARAIEHRRVERDGIDEIVAADHVRDERLACRDIERVHHAEKRGNRKHVRHLDAPGEREAGERAGEQHRGRLRCDENRVTSSRVCNRPADRREQEHRNLPGKADQTQERRRAREPIHKPRLGNRLHPRARQRDELPAEEESIVAVTQGAKRIRTGAE